MFIYLIIVGELYKIFVIMSEIVLFIFLGFVLCLLLFGVVFFVFILNYGMWMLVKFCRCLCGYLCLFCNYKWFFWLFVIFCEYYRLKCNFYVFWFWIVFVYICECLFGYLLDFVDVCVVIGFLFCLFINGFCVFICWFVFDWRFVMFICEKCIFLYCVGLCGVCFCLCMFVWMVIEFIDVCVVIVLNLYYKWIFICFWLVGMNFNFVWFYKFCFN